MTINRMVIALFLALAFSWPCAILAQDKPAAQTALSEELRLVLNGLDEANKKVTDVKADIEYLRDIPLLDESQKSEGSLEFKKPDLIHLKLGKPRNEEVYTDEKVCWIISHNDKQVEKYQLAGKEDAIAEVSFLMIGYGERSENLVKKYNVTLEGKSADEGKKTKDGKPVTVYRVKFVPRDEKARFSAIEIEVADDVWLPRKIVLRESEGEMVQTFSLKNVKLNTGLKEAQFTYQPPRGYVIVTQE